MIEPKVITAPTQEPVTIWEIRDHLRIDDLFEDYKLDLFRKVAREYWEWRTGTTIYETTYEIALATFPAGGCPIELPRAAPLQSVTWVRYVESDGTVQTWASSLYIVDTYEKPAKIVPAYGESYPAFTAYPINPVRVRYVAGEVTSPIVAPPESVRQGIFLLIGGMYENRESEVITDLAAIEAIAMSYGVEAMIERMRAAHAF